VKAHYGDFSSGANYHEWIENRGVLGHLVFFESLLNCLKQFIGGYGTASKRERRIALWYLLAEPGMFSGELRMKEKASNFWGHVRRKVDESDFDSADE
jgi:hypothetical protein